MKNYVCTVFLFMGFVHIAAQTNRTFYESDGLVTAEAEHFLEQNKTVHRQWYITSTDSVPGILPDPDKSHAATASNASYLEILPDTRSTHDDALVNGVNFSNTPGALGVISYNVHFVTTGKYYVWVRAYSTGTEDNGIHVGIDGSWPASGRRMQWCDGKQQWYWESKQRTDANHCGEPYKIYLDINTPGVHQISFSMREDGFEFDKWLMTTDRYFRPEGAGPDEVTTGLESFGAFVPVPGQLRLSAYPNPFNPATRIEFELPERDAVTMMITGSDGRIVHQWQSGYLQAGSHSFEWHAKGCAAGIYCYQLRTVRGLMESGRCTLLK